MKNTQITITLASVGSYSIWSLFGLFETTRLAFSRTNREPLAAAFGEAVYAIPMRNFLMATFGRNYLGSKLPITVITPSKDFSLADYGLDRKVDEFEITWEVVSSNDERIAELRQWAGQ